jgi:hypothetical protein
VRFREFPALFDQEYVYGIAPPETLKPVIDPKVRHVALVMVGFPERIGVAPITTVTGFLKDPGQIPT